MKKLCIITGCAIVLASCNALKRTPASGPAAPSQSKAKKGDTSLVFIESISIGKKDSRDMNRVQTSVPPPDNLKIESSLTPETFYKLQFKYAILLDVPVEEMTDHKMLEFLESWYGTKYRMGGVDKAGVDCSAFVQSFMVSMYGRMVPRTSAEQYAQCERISKTKLMEGDLVFFRTQRKKPISHVGVYLRNNKFVHASTSSGVMISDLSEEYFSKRYAGSGRYKNEDAADN